MMFSSGLNQTTLLNIRLTPAICIDKRHGHVKLSKVIYPQRSGWTCSFCLILGHISSFLNYQLVAYFLYITGDLENDLVLIFVSCLLGFYVCVFHFSVRSCMLSNTFKSVPKEIQNGKLILQNKNMIPFIHGIVIKNVNGTLYLILSYLRDH